MGLDARRRSARVSSSGGEASFEPLCDVAEGVSGHPLMNGRECASCGARDTLCVAHLAAAISGRASCVRTLRCSPSFLHGRSMRHETLSTPNNASG